MTETRKYRKKPIIIEAYIAEKEELIETLEGTMKADIGDYIITGVKGEKYPCKPDVFKKTYESLDYTDYMDDALIKMANELSFEKVLEMLEDKFKYGVVKYRDDGLVEISPRGWSDDEHLLYVLGHSFKFRQHCIGSIHGTKYFVKDKKDRYKNYDIIEVDKELEK